ncbi:MAG: putative nucleotidyltransferase with HDIG domain [Candidatus Krumholzibacteriia bacterium]|jgi:putative nucleotidyltransferase with HDIG domain
MSAKRFRLSSLFKRNVRGREGKGSGRGAVKSASKGSGSGERPTLDNSPRWMMLAGSLILVLHLLVFLPVPKISMEFPEAGQISSQEIRAPFSFDAALLDEDVDMLRLERVVVEPPVLRVLKRSEQGSRVAVWLSALAAAINDSTATSAQRVGMLNLQFPSAGTRELLNLLSSDVPDSLVPRMDRAWRSIETGGVVDMLPAGKYDRVVVLSGQAETIQNRAEVVAQANLEEHLTAALRKVGMTPLESVETAAVMRHFIRPNLVYDADQTGRRRENARQAVPTKREFINGERIVDQGVRVTEQQALYLAELGSLLSARGSGEDSSGRLARYAARVLMLMLSLGLFGWMAAIHFRDEMRQWRVVAALTVVTAIFVGGASVALSKPGLGPLAVPIVLLALLTTVLFRPVVGYATTFLAVALLSFLPDVGASSIFVWLVLGAVTVISVRRVQKRSQFYQTMVLLTVLSTVMIFLIGPEMLGLTGNNIYLVGISVPLLSVAFGLFLLPIVEPLVGVCSDLTLLELSDLNHPLLQRMALEAQGTYHHSQVVGQLGEHGARAIGANALLTRVGALFHDIGKMQKSEYYVENQNPNYNKHDELSPSMSALVIGAHVKDGIELARKWRLPQKVIDFIPMHHGTMVMEFFYHKALEADGNETVKVDDFRYPGPKPQTRETAILMLADAVEAATRSLPKPTPSRIKEITKQIFDKRMLSGEMDESNLSLSDIALVRDAFVPLLSGIHHARIAYPSQSKVHQEKITEPRGERKTDRKSETKTRV